MKLNFNLPKLSNSEYHYLIDCEVERELNPHHNDDSIVVFEYTSNIKEIINELVTNKIQFSHYISPDVELSYIIIDNVTLDFSLLNTNTN